MITVGKRKEKATSQNHRFYIAYVLTAFPNVLSKPGCITTETVEELYNLKALAEQVDTLVSLKILNL